MKNFFVSAGMVAVSAAGFQSAYAADLDIVSPKAWNVSATLRGFYDDNYSIASKGKGSGGVEFLPSVSLNVPLQQTDIGLKYTYGLYYYQDRDSLGLNPFDQTHQLDLWLDHSFSERWKANVTDNLGMGQEPELIGPSSPSSGNPVQYRVTGNNLANHASFTLSTDWTRLFSTALHYGNSFYDYDNTGATLGGPVSGVVAILPSNPANSLPGWDFLSPGGPSLAGLLNRVEQSLGLDLQWHFQPQTMGFIGYNFSLVNYNGNEPIGVYNYYIIDTSHFGHVVYRSDARDSMSHYAYLGVKHEFAANLSGTLRGGVNYTDNYNDPLQNSTSLSPYVDLSASYTYLPGSYVQLGFTHDINATDIANVNQSTGSLTQYQESSVVYADINHRFSPKLIGTLIGRCQYSTYNGGGYDGGSDTSYGFGANLHYQLNNHFSTELGYNFDDLVSGIAGRSYERNRVYVGLGVTY